MTPLLFTWFEVLCSNARALETFAWFDSLLGVADR